MLACILVAGCSFQTNESVYAGIVRINGEEYYAQHTVENSEFSIKEKIGEVKQRIDQENVPKENWSSNGFDAGTEIYSTNEKDHVFLLKTTDGKYQILTKEAKDAQP